ncbi:purine-cytosine permease family protein [Leifsonia xyli]|uniref:purine-cytosine permease family protein n=1 Tax=Leifsonia xyli TaxID=1575 RepID=UPI000A6D0CCA
MFWLWFAGTSSLISVGVGATLFVLGLSLRQLLVATLVGVALSFLPLGLGTLAGKWSGQPTLVVSRATFGMRGNLLPTVIALVVKLFWGSVLLWLAGSAAGSLTEAEGWPGNAVGATVTALAVTIAVAVAVAYIGYALVARVQLVLTIASAVLIVLMIMATWQHVDLSRALDARDALWTHVVTGAVLVLSYVGLAWAMSSAEVARYQRPLSSGGAAMLWATFGAGVPPFVLVSYGGLLAASNPGWAADLAQDPVGALVGLGLPGWYPVPLLLAVGLSLVSALVLTLYSTGFTIDALGVRLGRRWSTLVAGAAVAIVGGVLAATVTDLSSVIRGVPTALSVPVAAWVGVFSGEMMLRTRRLHSPSLLARGGAYPDWRWTNLALLVAGTAVGLGTVSSPLPWLGWEGYLFRMVGIDPQAGIGTSNIGVVIALVIGLFGVLVSAVPAVRRQEQSVE